MTSKKIFAVYALLLFPQMSLALEKNLKAGLAGNAIDDRQAEVRVFRFLAELQLEQEFAPNLTGKIGVGVKLETGSNNSLILDEYAPKREWSLIEGYLNWQGPASLVLRLGAINQGELNSPLLVDNSAFLGLVEEFSLWESSVHRLYFLAQQSIPNNRSLSRRMGSVEEGTPTFFHETLGFDLNHPRFKIALLAGRFRFSELSTQVAYNSQFMGNSVAGNSPLLTKFLYPFEGYNLSLEQEINFTPTWGGILAGQYLYNKRAPQYRNLGHRIRFGVRFREWRFFLENFKNESDTSPGHYNDKFYGHNNRRGKLVGVVGLFAESKLDFSLRYGRRVVIDSLPYQSNGSFFSFKIKKPLNF